MIALNHLSPFISLAFILGLIAAAYSTADSALTSLTTSYCVDFLDMEAGSAQERDDTIKRRWVHVAFSILLFLVIIVFNWLNNDAVINGLFKAAGYTYGPILGLFVYALIRKKHKGPDPKWAIILVCVIAPILTYILDINDLFCGFKLGFLNLLLNGLISLLLISLVYWKYEKDH